MNSHASRGPELLLAIVLGAIALAGTAWIALKLPTPRCLFHDLTGLPCVGCGGSRSVRSFLDGDLASAWAWNPLVFLIVLISGMVGVYSFAVVSGAISPIRPGRMSRFQANLLRAAVVTVLIANWIYLISRGV